MRDYSRVHPELRASLTVTPTLNAGPKTLWLFRAVLKLLPLRRQIPRDVSVQDLEIAGEQRNTIRLKVYRPVASSTARPALLWIHGGGYVMGQLEMDHSSCVEYARELGLVVVSVNYRLAPEHPFPAALDDCLSAFMWMHARAGELGIDTARIAVGGASAGGGLAAALAQLVSDRKEVSCAFQLLIYPMLDDRTSQPAAADDDEHFVWTKVSNRFGWRSYLGDTLAAREPPAYAVPARREDLAGVPPAWIGVGTADLFHDEDLAYAHRLKESGVDCEVYVVAGAYHGFDVTFLRPAIVKSFRAAQLAALRRHLIGDRRA